ncbi:MAG: type II toxin-antitoxin system RelE/ParE family toxin [Proteobacteria bacterium]|nr:type II toxin-antitoxin system RelE/ParE family toxin [Pseudomonadota bacterium]
MKYHQEVIEFFETLDHKTYDKTEEMIDLLEEHGNDLDRMSGGKWAHSIKGAKYPFKVLIPKRAGKGPIVRVAFFVDKDRTIHLLCGGDKRGIKETLFYERFKSKASVRIGEIKRGQYGTDYTRRISKKTP